MNSTSAGRFTVSRFTWKHLHLIIVIHEKWHNEWSEKAVLLTCVTNNTLFITTDLYSE